MKSIAEAMIYASLTNKENPNYDRCMKRKEMFEIIKVCDFETRCAIVDNLLSLLKFDCDYKTCEDYAIEELEKGLKDIKKIIDKLEIEDDEDDI